MIALDTSSLVAYLSGTAEGPDVNLLDQALRDRLAVLPPVVLSEILSDPKLPAQARNYLMQLPLLAVTDGYWERVGLLRARLLARRRRARLADSLIAQSCIDHDVALVSRDADFRGFARYGRLKLLPPQ